MIVTDAREQQSGHAREGTVETFAKDSGIFERASAHFTYAAILHEAEPRQAAVEQGVDDAPLPANAVEFRPQNVGRVDVLTAPGQVNRNIVAAAIVHLDSRAAYLSLVEHVAGALFVRAE